MHALAAASFAILVATALSSAGRQHRHIPERVAPELLYPVIPGVVLQSAADTFRDWGGRRAHRGDPIAVPLGVLAAGLLLWLRPRAGTVAPGLGRFGWGQAPLRSLAPRAPPHPQPA